MHNTKHIYSTSTRASSAPHTQEQTRSWRYVCEFFMCNWSRDG